MKRNMDAGVSWAKEFVTISDFMTIIPFTCLFLLNEACRFISLGRGLRLVLDFTHDICQQRFKLGVVSIAAYHFVRGVWRSTVLPVFYCLSSKENTSAYLPLLQAVYEEFWNRFSLDLRSLVRTIFTDGAIAARIAIDLIFPDALQILCLQHAKRNLAKKGSLWLNGNKCITAQKVVECASLISNPYLRDLVIRRYLDKLEGRHVSDPNAVNEWKIVRYLKK